jgi:DNA-binding GntR family transcriptional regulator
MLPAMTPKDLTVPPPAPDVALQDGEGSAPVEKPLYLQIVEALQREVLAGVYPVGTPLPSEAALVARFGVSRHTVREALRTLRESGLVSSHQGLGTLVRRPGDNSGYVHQVNTISDLFPVNVETRYAPVDGTLVTLPAAESLSPQGVAAGQWLRVRAVRIKPGDEAPFNELDVYVAARFAGVGRVIGAQPGPIYGMIEALYGETIGEVEQVFGAFACDGDHGRALGMQPGDFGIEVRRIFRLAKDGEVAMISFNRYLPSAFSFSMTLRKVRT